MRTLLEVMYPKLTKFLGSGFASEEGHEEADLAVAEAFAQEASAYDRSSVVAEAEAALKTTSLGTGRDLTGDLSKATNRRFSNMEEIRVWLAPLVARVGAERPGAAHKSFGRSSRVQSRTL